MRKRNITCLISSKNQPLVCRFSATLILAIALGGCGRGGNVADHSDSAGAGLPTAGTLGEQDVASVADYLSLPPYAGADRNRGGALAQACRTCHSFDAGGPHMIGPNLFGVFGRRSGTRAGFDYSEVLRNADFIWTPRALDAWLAAPFEFLPGNRMSFVGIDDPRDRTDVIAYLLETTSSTQATTQASRP